MPDTILTRYFKGIKHLIITNDDKYRSLSAVTTKISGAKMSDNFFFGIKRK
ncbi:MAG: DUF2924 domain-containing protein [Alphaproteobacteria bacterium]|nr:DUF2924 domain-containing protein [Alphaproteobacteria bacterium]